jgi:protein-S-isoprenylcysteine O-methyltransferase Ste14
MWTIRLVLLGLLIVLVASCGYLLKHRKKYKNLLENRGVNLAMVVSYLLLCFVMVLLPSDPRAIPSPAFFLDASVRIGFSVIGWILIGLAILVWIIALRQRKALGGQDVVEGLLTSGIYQYFRHPLYTATICICLGAALVTGNRDGLLMFPAVFVVNIAEAVIEERCDVGVRFPSEYREYRKRTRMLGPIWAWGILLVCVLTVAVIPHFS